VKFTTDQEKGICLARSGTSDASGMSGARRVGAARSCQIFKSVRNRSEYLDIPELQPSSIPQLNQSKSCLAIPEFQPSSSYVIQV